MGYSFPKCPYLSRWRVLLIHLRKLSKTQSNYCYLHLSHQIRSDQEEKKKSRAMADWGPILIGVILFVLLQPGLLFQFPGNNKQLEFGSMKTNGKAIAVHTLFFFAIYAILTLALHIHIYTG